MRGLGALLLVGGLLGAIYFFLLFNTTVQVPISELGGQSFGGGSVNNIGLLADRQNGLLVSIGAAILGAILMATSSAAPPIPAQEPFYDGSKSGTTTCPHCAEEIKPTAKICRFCNRDVT